MARGTKRKAKQIEESKSTEELPKESTKASIKAKRVKASASRKHEVEPEYFPEKRNLEDLWQAAFPVGTEWDQLDSLNKFKWNFSNLENAFEEGGVLHGKKVYVFSCTEPQLVAYKDENKIICIPVVVAVVSPFPPSDMIGIKSVQRETEEIIPMRQMKMDWVPYIPLEDRNSQVDRLNSQIYILNCTQRR
ncbi:protein HEAT INTOLERANT 4-like [Telopea speciosissima]|uniref:protein HEAT INTOLERANT 4-like n=1 Tax=Telopea speciosissima TaxID=54955 RepID=UPI001CC46239|nr:protein HEAT INTOLERANT 4-like [Telopea speciosissima]